MIHCANAADAAITVEAPEFFNSFAHEFLVAPVVTAGSHRQVTYYPLLKVQSYLNDPRKNLIDSQLAYQPATLTNSPRV